MDFLTCVRIVLDHEGYISDDSNDPGGLTKYGISSRAYPSIDVSELTEDEAIAIYEKDYWEKMQSQYLPPKLRLMIFDCAVNQGATRAAMFLQRACGAAADGVIGPRTLFLMKEFKPEFLIDSIARQRLQAYIRNPKWTSYGSGWSSRLLDITLRCLI